MLERWESLTKKYAQAFLNIYGTQLNEHIITHLTEFEKFIRQNKRMYAYLCLTGIPLETKKKLLHTISSHFSLPEYAEKLITVLLAHRRIDLLALTLKKIIAGYQKRQDIALFNIFASHVLENKEKEIIRSFISKVNPHATITLEFHLDQSLISGLKIQSESLLWERSVAKQLKLIKIEALQRVRL